MAVYKTPVQYNDPDLKLKEFGGVISKKQFLYLLVGGVFGLIFAFAFPFRLITIFINILLFLIPVIVSLLISFGVVIKEVGKPVQFKMANDRRPPNAIDLDEYIILKFLFSREQKDYPYI